VKSAALKLPTLGMLACWIGPVLAADIPDSDKKAVATYLESL
jgi:hypothetical protein